MAEASFRPSVPRLKMAFGIAHPGDKCPGPKSPTLTNRAWAPTKGYAQDKPKLRIQKRPPDAFDSAKRNLMARRRPLQRRGNGCRAEVRGATFKPTTTRAGETPFGCAQDKQMRPPERRPLHGQEQRPRARMGNARSRSLLRAAQGHYRRCPGRRRAFRRRSRRRSFRALRPALPEARRISRFDRRVRESGILRLARAARDRRRSRVSSARQRRATGRMVQQTAIEGDIFQLVREPIRPREIARRR